jgi:hypothetical protein
MPDDKILIYEDTNGDGKADKETVFADKLHLPIGFEFAPEGVYLSQEPNLVLLRDTNGDDKADSMEIVLGGFDTHDTHHAISAYTADPSGAFMMCEGVFLHSNIETPYGPVRCVDGGFFRYSPQRGQLERTIQMSIPNPWGFVFDKWGQDFLLHTSGTTMNWALPVEVKPTFGSKTPSAADLVPKGHKVRPTSGLEIVSSRHFPDEVQGDLIYCNAIGFLGIKQVKIEDDGTGWKTITVTTCSSAPTAISVLSISSSHPTAASTSSTGTTCSSATCSTTRAIHCATTSTAASTASPIRAARS